MDHFWDGFEKQASAAARAKKFLTRGVGSLPKELQRGIKVEAIKGGTPDSLFMMPLTWGAKKIKGESKVNRALWRKIHRPATSVDTAAGNIVQDTLGKIPGLRNMFKLKHNVQVKRKGEKLLKEFERPSITAPLSKAQKVLAPFALGLAAEKMIKGDKDETKPNKVVS